jgi:hypothetical protein
MNILLHKNISKASILIDTELVLVESEIVEVVGPDSCIGVDNELLQEASSMKYDLGVTLPLVQSVRKELLLGD